jgi:hypothetical protein
MALLNESIRDLDLCSGDTDEFIRPHFYSLRAASLLKRGELHCQLGSVEHARVDCSNAEAAVEEWFRLTRAAGEAVPDKIESDYRTRLHKLRKCVGVDQAAFQEPVTE